MVSGLGFGMSFRVLILGFSDLGSVVFSGFRV